MAIETSPDVQNHTNTAPTPVNTANTVNSGVNGSRMFNVSTRSLIAVVLIGTFCVAVVMKIVPADKFDDLTEMVAAFYFGHSVGKSVPGQSL